MIYLEMTRDSTHGGGEWAFTYCVWSPAKKKGGSTWPFWRKILQVKDGDMVIHLKGKARKAAFIGYSFASGDGFETGARPPQPGEWGYSDRFCRANLKDFTPFHSEIALSDVFSTRRPELENYFEMNKSRKKEKANIFFVRQSNRLQCLNGAYFSDVEEELFKILFASEPLQDTSHLPAAEQGNDTVTVPTGTQITAMQSRIGQFEFAKQVKNLYSNRCCVPGCSVSDPRFLVAAHIARWTDNEGRRGDLSNGLCLCLMHDKSFELGLFSLDDQLNIFVNLNMRNKQEPHLHHLVSQHGKKMRLAKIVPSLGALREHWERTEIDQLTGRIREYRGARGQLQR